MKHIKHLSIYLLLLFVFLSGYGNQTFGQDKFNIAVGFGYPELANIGTKFQVKQDTLLWGISIGIEHETEVISGNVFYHFGGYSRLSHRRPWYLKSGVNIIHETQDESSDLGILFNLRLGRDINLSKKVGLDVEAGLGYSPFADILIDEMRVFPSFGLYVFYRI